MKIWEQSALTLVNISWFLCEEFCSVYLNDPFVKVFYFTNFFQKYTQQKLAHYLDETRIFIIIIHSFLFKYEEPLPLFVAAFMRWRTAKKNTHNNNTFYLIFKFENVEPLPLFVAAGMMFVTNKEEYS